MSEFIDFETQGSIAKMTLNRPRKLNAMNDEMLLSMLENLHSVANNRDLRVLIVSGEGRAFSAGGDIASMENMDESSFSDAIHLYMRLSQAFRNLSTINIAAINGYALAGGFELALMCDIRISAASALYGLPDGEIGLSPTSGMTWLLPRIVGYGRALHLTLTGGQFGAVEAERIGLVTAVVDDDRLGEHVMTLARRIAAYPDPVVAKTKAAFSFALEQGFSSTMSFEEQCEMECFASPQTREALRQALKSGK